MINHVINHSSVGVWRSLVARLNGVQEVASSILVTPTKKEKQLCRCFSFLIPLICNCKIGTNIAYFL